MNATYTITTKYDNSNTFTYGPEFPQLTTTNLQEAITKFQSLFHQSQTSSSIFGVTFYANGLEVFDPFTLKK